MTTELLFERTAGGMRLADQATVDALAKIPVGQLFAATLHSKGRARSIRHHRLFMGLLAKISAATGYGNNADELLFKLKVALGYCDIVQTFDKKVGIRARSISFETMPQDRFRAFFEDAIKVLAAEVLPEINDDPVVNEIYSILDGAPAGQRAA